MPSERARLRPLRVFPLVVEATVGSEIPNATWLAIERNFGVIFPPGLREDVQEAFDIWAVGRQVPDFPGEDLRRIAEGEARLEQFDSRSKVARDVRAEMALRRDGEHPTAQSAAWSLLRRYQERKTFLEVKLGQGRLQELDRDRVIKRIARMLKRVGIEPKAYRSNTANSEGLAGSIIEVLNIIMHGPPSFLLNEELQPFARRAQRMGDEGQFRGL
jgi:hypothetical protein